MKAKLIKESTENVLVPKSVENIGKDIIKEFEINLGNDRQSIIDYVKKYVQNKFNNELDAFIYKISDNFFKSILSPKEQIDLFKYFIDGYDIVYYVIPTEYDQISDNIPLILKPFGWKEFYSDSNGEEDEFIFIKPAMVKESVENILVPKTKENIIHSIDKEKISLMNDCYDIISQYSDRFIISIDLGINFDIRNHKYYYGFNFEKYPIKDNLDEYTIKYIDVIDGILLQRDYINSYGEYDVSELEISDLTDLLFYFGIYEPITESVQNVLKPKSDEELEFEFKKKYPVFSDIVNKLFPGTKLNLSTSEDNVEAHIAFTSTDRFGDEHTFLLKQDRYKDLPTISHLDKSSAGHGFSGAFVNNQSVTTPEDVERYVDMTMRTIYDYDKGTK